jgi:hypothetical protein
MAYREVTMIEIKEVLRLWRAGTPKKRIASQLTLDIKTVRRYITAAETTGLAAPSASFHLHATRQTSAQPGAKSRADNQPARQLRKSSSGSAAFGVAGQLGEQRSAARAAQQSESARAGALGIFFRSPLGL